jgi:hypothetical protein
MSRKKKSVLPRIEIIIVLVFFMSFIIWAVSKCNDTKLMYQEQADLEEEETSDEEETASLDNVNPSNATNSVSPGIEAAETTTNANQAAAQPSTAAPSRPLNNTVQSSGSILYVTIDGLNLRTAPHLDSTIIRKLKLFEEVIFMNEVTDSTQTISLGKEIATEPWVKVKHKRGFVGWVYGAGINYYKKKRSGVE